jgi:uncharacterized damage-inducible protein DinB
MRALDHVRALYDYNEWADDHVLKAASGLSEEELRRDAGASYGSVAETLRHIVEAQHGWWCFWTGTEWVGLPELPEAAALQALREWFGESHARLRDFVNSLSEKDTGRILTDTDDEGQRQEFVLWVLLLHVVNHGTQHRSEVATALTQMGQSPGDLDFVDFVVGLRS